MPHLIRSGSLVGYAEVARSLGLDPLHLIAQVGLPRECLTDGDLRIPIGSVARLLDLSAELSGADDFGLRMSDLRRVSSTGVFGLLLRDQPTLGRMIEAALPRAHLISDALVLRFHETAEVCILALEMDSGAASRSRQIADLQVASVLRVIQWTLGAHYRPQAVCFSRPPPTDRRAYTQRFGPIVEFDHDFDGIVLPRADLDLPLPNADPDFARRISGYVDELELQSAASATSQVRERIGALLPSGDCTARRVARHLGVDRRTIQRRLEAEGESFSGLLERVRRERATSHLAYADRPLAEVSSLLGFSAQSAFTRWFRTVFGEPPGRWRRARRQGAAEGQAAMTRPS